MEFESPDCCREPAAPSSVAELLRKTGCCRKGVSPRYCRILLDSLPLVLKGWAHGAQTPSAISWGDLSCHEPGRSAGADFQRRRGSPAFSGDAGRGVREDWLASACLLLDVEPFSFGGRNSEGEPGGRHEMVFGHLYFPLQPAARALGSLVQRSLQIADCGRQRRRLPADRVRLRTPQSSPSQTSAFRRTPAKLSVEQLS